MKTLNITRKLFAGGIFACAALMTSCDDFLTLLPTDSIPDEHFWTSKEDLYGVRASAYIKATSDDALSRILYWGEFRAIDNVKQANSNSSLTKTMEGELYPDDDNFKWDVFYSSISYCNKVLEMGEVMINNKDKYDPTFADSEWQPIKAEVTALRALMYFYLVKAYRDVPFVTRTISTDAEALQARKGMPVTQGARILQQLIAQLEATKDFAPRNYGNASDNKGRFTRNGVKALLADIYLWEASLLNKGIEKGYKLLDENGNTITDQATLNTMRDNYLAKASDLCDDVINDVLNNDVDYVEYKKQNGTTNDIIRNQVYPLYQLDTRKGFLSTTDDVYQRIWGSKNSFESILEFQFNGSSRVNNTVKNSYFSSSGGTPMVSGRDELFASVATVINGYDFKGFGKTDSRMLQCVSLPDKTSQNYLIHKNAYTSYAVNDWADMAKGVVESTISKREDSSQNANWPVYRISDLMLIKAECNARRNNNVAANFNMIIELHKRYNPTLGYTGYSTSPLIEEGYADSRNATELLQFVYNERQREFYSEGKRWFDLVRQAEWQNDAANALQTYMVNVQAKDRLINRLRKLCAMYVPYNYNEIKQNPALVQNEVWDRYTPIETQNFGK